MRGAKRRASKVSGDKDYRERPAEYPSIKERRAGGNDGLGSDELTRPAPPAGAMHA